MTEEETDRIRYITERSDVPSAKRNHFDDIAESRGSVTGPFSVLLNSPEVAGRTADLGAYIRFESDLSGSVRELAIITVAREFDCSFEWAYHEELAKGEGVTDEAIEKINTNQELDGLSGEEYYVPKFVRQLLRTNSISDDVYEDLTDEFKETVIVELVATVGYYAMLACVLNAFEVKPGEDSTLIE